jgi:hypothetical protein
MAMEDSREQTRALDPSHADNLPGPARLHTDDDAAAVVVQAVTVVYRFLCSHVATVVGVFLFIASWLAKSHFLGAYVGEYDEGIIVSGANVLLLGGAPYRDFYTNYPPGIFLALAGLWKVFGVSLASYRLFAVAIHLGLAFVAGRLAGRMAGVRRRFSWLACGVVSVWTIHLQVIPYAWIAGLALMAFTVDRILAAIDEPARHRFVLAGVVYGLVSCFRHDLFVHFTWITGLLLLMPSRAWSRFCASKPSWKRVGEFLLGAAIPIVLVWVPVAIAAGIPLILRDILLDQVRYVMPGRVLPMPPLFQMAAGAHLPPFVVNHFAQAVFITLAAPALVLLHCIGKRSERTALVFLFPVTVAVIPQMMGRTDSIHAVYTVLPGLVLLTAFVERIWARTRFSAVRAVLPALFAVAITDVLTHDFMPVRGLNRAALRPTSPELRIEGRGGFQFDPNGNGDNQRRIKEFIQANTDKKERVYFGLPNHESLVLNEVSPYFFVNRLPGVRWSQFDPNMVTGRPVQEEMIASMERYHVRVVVLSSRFVHYREWQPPVVKSSPLLDTYIREHFTERERLGPYTILTRDL